MASLIGKEIGKYRITERLGQGGMAEVYLGIHTHLDRKVAVKVLHSHLLEGGDFVARFKREAKAVANLRHPNIIQVHDFDVQEDLIFMVMEYIDGTNLHARLVEVGNRGEKLPLKLIGSIINDISSALDYAHSKGMLHRDIKPSNILIDQDDKAYLVDFGIAKLLSDQKFTATGTLVGTPAYMSPEQGRGDELTEESDIYSLGIVAFEMLTGQVPYDARTPIGIVHKQINDPVPNISELVDGVPGTAQAVINRALAKSPEGRYSSAEALTTALRIALEALESTDPIAAEAQDDHPTLIDDGLESPTVTMDAADLEQSTVIMEDAIKKEKVEKKPQVKEVIKEKPKPKVKKEGKPIPLWAFIAGGVGLLAVIGVILTQVLDLNLSGSTPDPESGLIAVSVDAGQGIDGISLLAGGDHDFEYVTVGDEAAWRTGNGQIILADDGNQEKDFYIEFRIDDSKIHQLPPNSEVFINVEYLDEGRDKLFIQYDSHDGGPEGDGRFRESPFITKTNSGKFLAGQFILDNAFFGNRDNGADFRISDNSDGAEVIRRVEVVYISQNTDQGSPDDEPSGPDGQPGEEINGEDLFHQGEAALGEGRSDEAIELLDRAIDAGFETDFLYHLRAWAFFNLGNTEGAIESWSRAIELNPENYEYWMERGLRKYDLGDTSGALDDLLVAREYGPDQWSVFESLGEVYYFSGQDQYFGEAHEAFDRAIELEPTNPQSRQMRAELKWFRNGDAESALEDLNIAVEYADPNNPGPNNIRGLIYLRTGQFELCIPDYTRAIEIAQEEPYLFLERGDCYAGLGEVDPASADYERFIELAGNNPEFNDLVARVQEWLGEH